MNHRIERDGIGSLTIPGHAYWGIHTGRAKDNFDVSGYRWPGVFITGLAQVKAACARTNMDLGHLDPVIGDAILRACDDLIQGRFHDQIIVDPFQGGAGTSTNMNLNEVIANRAIEVLGGAKGDYDRVHPLHHVNMHQSTNDVFPTGLTVAVMRLLKGLENDVARLQESFQERETVFRDVVKVGRTQLQDAVPMTLGMEFGAYAEAIARDRWRIFKCRERIKQINLGGTAIGTGLGAPRDYILRVADHLRRMTGLNLSRCENLVDATQNQDSFVETSGMLKTYASNLLKISTDLRFLASGPHAGLAEIRLPIRQTGSTIMPGKINPVIPEMVAQAALQVMANDYAVTLAASLGNLELSQFMPLLAWNILESLQILLRVSRLFRDLCVTGIEADTDQCYRLLMTGHSVATALVPFLGYETVERAVRYATEKGVPVVDACCDMGLASREAILDILSPRRMQKLGFEPSDFDPSLKNDDPPCRYS
ncbi:aspartate ammonia-lyase [bacterium]|nr:aspartate ammonia-lyase [candidate division CSSED10-310 bacterium]